MVDINGRTVGVGGPGYDIKDVNSRTTGSVGGPGHDVEYANQKTGGTGGPSRNR